MKKCGSPCKTGKPCKKTSPCSVHGSEKSAGKSSSPQTPPENKLKDPLFRRLENLPVEVIWQTLLNVPLDQIHAVCVAYPKGKIAAICSDPKFQKAYGETSGLEYRSIVEKAAYLYIKSGWANDQSFEKWVVNEDENDAYAVIVDTIIRGESPLAFGILLYFAKTALKIRGYMATFEKCMEKLLNINYRGGEKGGKNDKDLREKYKIFYNNYKRIIDGRNNGERIKESSFEKLLQKDIPFGYIERLER